MGKTQKEAQAVVKRLNVKRGDIVLVQSDDGDAAYRVVQALSKANVAMPGGPYVVPIIVVGAEVTVTSLDAATMAKHGWVRKTEVPTPGG